MIADGQGGWVQTIDLPVSTWLVRGTWLCVCATLGGIALLPVIWPWRLLVGLATLGCSVFLVRRYLRNRPVAVQIGDHGGLACVGSDGQLRKVLRCRPGVVNPRLLMAVLSYSRGASSDLVVPAGVVSADAHRRLRVAVLGHRADRSPHPLPL